MSANANLEQVPSRRTVNRVRPRRVVRRVDPEVSFAEELLPAWVVWLLWVSATALGGAIAALAVWSYELMEGLALPAPQVLVAGLVGAVLAAIGTQLAVLNYTGVEVRPVKWVAASGLGAALSILPVAALAFFWSNGSYFGDPDSAQRTMSEAAASGLFSSLLYALPAAAWGALLGAVGGLIMGVVQWFMLSEQAVNAQRWLWVSVAAGTAAGTVGLYVAYLGAVLEAAEGEVFTVYLPWSIFAGSLIVGGLTGLVACSMRQASQAERAG